MPCATKDEKDQAESKQVFPVSRVEYVQSSRVLYFALVVVWDVCHWTLVEQTSSRARLDTVAQSTSQTLEQVTMIQRTGVWNYHWDTLLCVSSDE